MRPTALNLAKSVSKRPLRLKKASAELLPPIPLYRRLLRAHRVLPEDMRFLGDSYVKTEFRATRSTDNPIHIIGFLSQWKLYLDQLQQSNLKPGEVFKGRVLQEEYFDKLSDEQAGQLYEFMHASKDLWKSPDQLEASAAEEERADHEATKQSLLNDPKAEAPPSEMTDPYPLPLSQPSLAEGSDEVKNNLDSLPKPLDRTGEDEKTLRARLVYQCRKRGTLETDLILSTFSKQYLDGMSVAQMQEFDKLLDEPDWDIYYWSVGKREVPERWRDTEILARLKKHAENHGRVVRTMPHLY